MDEVLFYSDFKLIDSKDSSWQEWLEIIECYYSYKDNIVIKRVFEEFDNARDPKSCYKKLLSEETIKKEELDHKLIEKLNAHLQERD